MAVVLINSVGYVSYADEDDAELYLAAAFHAANWNTADELTKQMALVTATRILDRQRWKGDKTDSDQALAWPRSNTAIDGVDDDVVPEKIVQATIELALSLVDGSEVQSAQSTAQAIQSLSAGSVSISYFRGAEGAPLRFPLIVMELVRDYLAGSGGRTAGVIAYGTTASSSVHSITEDDFGLSGPL